MPLVTCRKGAEEAAVDSSSEDDLPQSKGNADKDMGNDKDKTINASDSGPDSDADSSGSESASSEKKKAEEKKAKEKKAEEKKPQSGTDKAETEAEEEQPRETQGKRKKTPEDDACEEEEYYDVLSWPMCGIEFEKEGLWNNTRGFDTLKKGDEETIGSCCGQGIMET